MGIFRPAVRFSLRTLPAWFLDHYRDIAQGIRNIVRWTPVIWHDEDFDWSSLAEVMEFKLRLMATEFRERGHHVNSDMDARRCLVCAELLKRLQTGLVFYMDEAEKRFGLTAAAAKHAAEVERNDQRYLGLLLGKYLNHWWD